MSAGAGIGAQLGIAQEETYGTYTAPTTFLPFTSESLSLEQAAIDSQGLRAGQFVQAEYLHIPTTRTVGGDVNLEFTTGGMGKILNLLHGETVTPSKVSEEDAYKQTHKFGLSAPKDKSLTIQVGRPDTEYTVRPFNYLGCKATSVTFAVESGGVMTVAVTIDGQDEDITETLGVATYSDAKPFDFTQMEVKIGGTKVANMRQISYQLDLPQATDRYLLGNSGLKGQPISNAMMAVTINATLEFAGLADHERYRNATVVSLETAATGAKIGTTKQTYSAKFSAPAAVQTSSGPTVQGPDVITQDVSFMVLANGSEAPLTVETVSDDSAL